MPHGREIELPLISKAPFANYDLVVYLGGGAFSILIFWKYIAAPFHIFDFSGLLASDDQSWVVDVLFLLLMGVCSYVLGHLVSYQSSYFIEGFIEKTLGKFSKLVEVTTVESDKRSKEIKKEIARNIRDRLFIRGKIPVIKVKFAFPKPFMTRKRRSFARDGVARIGGSAGSTASPQPRLTLITADYLTKAPAPRPGSFRCPTAPVMLHVTRLLFKAGESLRARRATRDMSLEDFDSRCDVTRVVDKAAKATKVTSRQKTSPHGQSGQLPL